MAHLLPTQNISQDKKKLLLLENPQIVDRFLIKSNENAYLAFVTLTFSEKTQIKSKLLNELTGKTRKVRNCIIQPYN